MIKNLNVITIYSQQYADTVCPAPIFTSNPSDPTPMGVKTPWGDREGTSDSNIGKIHDFSATFGGSMLFSTFEGMNIWKCQLYILV